MWLKSRLSLLLLVGLCFSFSAYSQDEQADITKTELMTLLNERETFKEALASLKAEKQIIIQELQTLKTESMQRAQELAILKIESQIRTDSLTTLKKETAWNNAGWFVTGLFAGAWTDSVIKDLTSP